MASMSGAATPTIPPSGPTRKPVFEDDLFTGLVVSDPPKVKRGLWMPASIVGHLAIVVALVAIPLLWPSPSPEHPDYIRALLYNPPPPPPPPLPKGSALVNKPEPAKPVTPDTKPDEAKLTTPVEVPKEEPLKPEARDPETEQTGSPTGSEIGVAEGMEEGVEGGVVGGVPGGVIGGVVGGTGDGPVLDFDQPPRLIKITRPEYPHDAFVKKIEGTVELEILIDINGRVVQARVVRSVPMLDAAAIATVRQWLFSPAIKNGRPVSTIARTPVNFRIY
jgi:protein TonB